MPLDEDLDDQMAAEEQSPMDEVIAIVAKENKSVFDIQDPIMILLTLGRILQREARGDMRRTLESCDAILREQLTEIINTAKDRETKLMGDALKHLDGIGKNLVEQILENAEIRLKDSLDSFIQRNFIPQIEKKMKRFLFFGWASLGTSLAILLRAVFF